MGSLERRLGAALRAYGATLGSHGGVRFPGTPPPGLRFQAMEALDVLIRREHRSDWRPGLDHAALARSVAAIQRAAAAQLFAPGTELLLRSEAGSMTTPLPPCHDHAREEVEVRDWLGPLECYVVTLCAMTAGPNVLDWIEARGGLDGLLIGAGGEGMIELGWSALTVHVGDDAQRAAVERAIAPAIAAAQATWGVAPGR